MPTSEIRVNEYREICNATLVMRASLDSSPEKAKVICLAKVEVDEISQGGSVTSKVTLIV